MTPKEKFDNLLKEILPQLEAIDKEVPFTYSVPKWLESLWNLQRHIGSYVKNDKRIDFHTEDGRVL